MNDITHEATMRLNRAIAQAGVCSRRKADELIFSGKIKVNGILCTDASRRVEEDDQIELEGRILRRQEEFIYIMLHKPPQVVSTVSDPQGRQTVLDLLPASLRKYRLYPVGRLDYFSEGLLLLTNDGDLAHRLMHPSHHKSKMYSVLVRGAVPESALRIMRRGMALDMGDKCPGEKLVAPMEVSGRLLPSGDTLLRMKLSQGINRQIRRMCEQLGLTILKLKRTGEGPLNLGDLPRGKFRPLTSGEVALLRSEARET